MGSNSCLDLSKSNEIQQIQKQPLSSDMSALKEALRFERKQMLDKPSCRPALLPNVSE